ncbi:unnamed protein product [Psylliodes chrysocephalus]|uniref:Uncharacterized protein n=1 Tax=Psylliodes chrysocephalus TaxID=3402493 RepID=A0A9P0CXZ8_9CUCU|nr:unnamed protein product [Psylliodes chrysocephala]
MLKTMIGLYFQEFPCNAGRFKSTFSDVELEELRQYIINIDKRAFGLTKKQFSRIIYDFAEKRHISHRFNIKKKKAGRHFVEWFMWKYNFSLRKPESTSIARLMGFNRQSVSNFFNALKELKEKYNFQPNQIYNIDETGVSTVATKNPRIITPKGKRRVIKISSAERGTNVTAVCAMNASGTFIPF